MEPYAYVGGDPINRTDPKGLSWQYASLSYNAPGWASPAHNGGTVGIGGFMFITFTWTSPFPATPLPIGSALRMAPVWPGVKDAYRQMSDTSAALNVMNVTHGLEHSRNILGGFRKYFKDHWSDPCVKWLNGGGLSRGDFKGRMDKVIENMRSGEFMDFEVYGPNGIEQYGVWSHTLHGWFEVYGGNRIMMNRNVEMFFNQLSLSKQQMALLHELGHIFGAKGFWQNDGAYNGSADQHPNNRLVMQNCGHLLGTWFHGR